MRARRWMTLGLALAAILGLGGPAEAQKNDDQSEPQPIGGLTFKDEYELTVVNLDVFVRASDGSAVTDLEADDFRVLQDGIEREVTNFALFTQEVFETGPEPTPPIPVPSPTPAEEEPPVAADEPEIKPIQLVLFVDNENLRPFDRNRVLSQVRSFLREFMNPYTHVMVVSHGRSMKVEQDFTQDAGQVIAALRDMRTSYAARVDREKERARILRDMQALRNQRDSSTDRSLGQGGVRRAAAYDDMRTFADEEAFDLRLTLESLRQVIQMLAGLPGRKSLIYISSGLAMIPGRDLFNEYQSIYQSETSVLPLEGRYNQRHEFRSLISSANAQGVRFYTIDASGLEVTSGVSAEYGHSLDPITATLGSANYQESLVYMADGTGGLAILNANDVTSGLERIKQDLFTYYSIGYPLTTKGGDTVHRIEVEVPAHPEYEVRYRRTFVEKSLETRVRDTVMSGLIFELGDNPMGIAAATSTPAPSAEDRWVVPLEVSCPLRSIALLPEGDEYVGRVVVYVAARDLEGRQSDIQRQVHEIRMPTADYENRRDERIVIELQMLMESGTYRIATGVMDQVTRQASYRVISQVVGGGG